MGVRDPRISRMQNVKYSFFKLSRTALHGGSLAHTPATTPSIAVFRTFDDEPLLASLVIVVLIAASPESFAEKTWRSALLVTTRADVLTLGRASDPKHRSSACVSDSIIINPH